MISDLDLWRAAQVTVKRYGKDAATEAAMRADDPNTSTPLCESRRRRQGHPGFRMA